MERVSKNRICNIRKEKSIDILEENIQENNVIEREKYWVRYMVNNNCSLFNVILYNNYKESKLLDSEKAQIITDFDKIAQFLKELKQVGKTIKNKRILKNIRQEDLAKLVNVNRSTIVLIEKNEIASFETLIKIIEALKDNEEYV